jgi:hypothetical protein
MSFGGEPGHLHPRATQRSSFRYFFYDKHHGRGGPEAARWLPELSDEEEFGIFDQADLLELSDEHGNLYGISIGPEPDREVRYLGTLRQQVAKFPASHPGAHWHGFPLGPLEGDYDPPHPPRRALPQDALRKMVARGLLDNTQRKRLLKGKNI